MYPWYYCQQLWHILSELCIVLGKMEEAHGKRVEKMLSPKIIKLTAEHDGLRMAIVHYFHMAAALAESYGYVVNLIGAGICPSLEQLELLQKNHLEPMRLHHQWMMEAMMKHKKSVDHIKKKYKGKELEAMKPLEAMLNEMVEMHEKIAQFIEKLGSFAYTEG